jgi:hypothetical protein
MTRIAVLLLVFAPLALADGPRPPFRCFTDPWADTYTIGRPSFDKKERAVTWELTAKKDGKPGRWEAFLVDENDVEIGVVKVSLSPARETHKAGAKVKATVSVRSPFFDDGCRLYVRPSK